MMTIFSVCKTKFSYYIYLFSVLLLSIPGCESIPSQTKGPDNPLDPNNPNNNITGPALVLSPTQLEVNNNGQFRLELWVVESDSVAAMSTRILYDPVKLKAQNVDSLMTNSESFFLQNSGQLIWFSIINNDSGFIQIDCAVVAGDPKDVEGRGVISRIIFQHVSGTAANINISSESRLRNSTNDVKNINDILGTTVTIK
jgi:hypothetical protein